MMSLMENGDIGSIDDCKANAILDRRKRMSSPTDLSGNVGGGKMTGGVADVAIAGMKTVRFSSWLERFAFAMSLLFFDRGEVAAGAVTLL